MMKIIDSVRENRAKGLAVAIVLCTGALVLFFMKMTQDKLTSKNDLTFIKGRLRDYHFSEGLRSAYYTFRLIESPTQIQVVADFLYLFDDGEFKKLSFGDSITVGLSSTGFERVHDNIQKRVIAYSITKGDKTFLDPAKTISNHNSPWSFVFSIPLFIWGCYLLFLVYKVDAERAQNNSSTNSAGEQIV